MVCYVVSLESPHRGNSNEYTKHTIFNIEKKMTLNYPKSAAIRFFSKGFKDEFETAVVDEPSVFEPLKFTVYFSLLLHQLYISYFCFSGEKIIEKYEKKFNEHYPKF